MLDPGRMSNRRPERTGTRRRGIAASEMALLVPFVSFLFIVAVDYCRIFYVTQTLQGCAHAGAMYASGTARVSSATTATEAAVRAALADGATLDPPLQPEKISVSSDGSTATVTVQYEYQTLTPLLGDSGKLVVTRTATLNMAPTPGRLTCN